MTRAHPVCCWSASIQSYAPTESATDKYHQDITKFYSSLSPELKKVAVDHKTIPRTLIVTPRQQAYRGKDVGQWSRSSPLGLGHALLTCFVLGRV